MEQINRLILASQSAGRRGLFEAMGIPVTAIAADVDEDVAGLSVEDTVTGLAVRKARAVHASHAETGDLVMAADTVILHRGRILGKPGSDEDAVAMLAGLSGQWHEVHTGLAVMFGQKLVAAHDMTKVKFRDLKEDEIRAYVTVGESAGRSGSYGIQGKGSMLVERIEGDITTVVGFPVAKFAEILKNEFGASIFELKECYGIFH